MRKLFFLNLSIDQNWARGSLLNQLFSSGNPVSLKLSLLPQNLALYHVDYNPRTDLLVVARSYDSFWMTHFTELSFLKSAKVLVNETNPYNVENWIQAFKHLGGEALLSEKIDELAVVALSDLELKLLEELNLKVYAKNLEFQFSLVNSKTWLFEWTQFKSLPFPESKIVKGKDVFAPEEENTSHYLFKSNISSGGSGQISKDRLGTLIPWVQRQSALNEWNSALWLKQMKCTRTLDFSCFGSTDQQIPIIVDVEYDENGLSYIHRFNSQLHSSEVEEVFTVYKLISEELKKRGYDGPFGFDGFRSKEGFYPIIDLNVRLTKTHLLFSSMQTWNLEPSRTVFYRKRFVNKSPVSFAEFWKSFCRNLNLDDQGKSVNARVAPIDVSGWMLGKSEITLAVDAPEEIIIKKILNGADLMVGKLNE